ncbi:LOW QUALITY PROTEIN: probable cytochrome P450 9f2 [Sitodiplosis mosellana]|uniref:LOW QUALITY PROTEIN: probable cytochrome P450 9f2 n=1 Tax=Sitodiplosis mosellana TaxID=263140 RepID=UPI0024446F5C|nr:LOW QUALITY PROTEIN: probable cytochrome P450 9f2 [Sitodiplosis mosellana]
MFGELILFAAISLIFYAFYKWATANNDYFERRNIKYIKPKFLIGSNVGLYLGKYTAAEFSDKLFHAFPNEAIYGLFDFRAPQFIVRDSKLYKHIFIKSFDNFEDHNTFVDEKTDKLWGNALFLMKGEKWRQMRATLSPAFTGSKMRQMFELVTECTDEVVKHFLNKVQKGEKVNIEMKDFFTRYTNDVIATCAFGLKINSFEDPTNEFYENGKILMDFTSIQTWRAKYDANDAIASGGTCRGAAKLRAKRAKILYFSNKGNFWGGILGICVGRHSICVGRHICFARHRIQTLLRFFIIDKFPAIARAFNISFSNGRVGNSFKNTILETMDIRKKNNIHRPDMINILMQIREGTLKNQTDDRDKIDKEGFATVEESEVGKVTVNRAWSDDEIVAQCFVFFAAGFDTSATLLTFSAYEIAVNPDVQQKLYEEIIETNQQLGGKRITYDALQKMKYLDQVICETLRKWPPATVNDRTCTKDYVYDDGEKIKFKVEKGAILFFPTFSIHRDPKNFNEPERFDPERFSDENKHTINPETYLPFGIGPRNCIGSRFALMEIKAILYNLLLNFSFEPNEKTHIPMKLKKTAFTLDGENGVHLELKPRKSLMFEVTSLT